MAIKDFEHTTFETIREVSSLKYEIELKDNEIANNVRRKVKTPDEIASLKDRKKNDTRF